VAERFKAAVLKTANPQGFVGSNPTPSATTKPGNRPPTFASVHKSRRNLPILASFRLVTPDRVSTHVRQHSPTLRLRLGMNLGYVADMSANKTPKSSAHRLTATAVRTMRTPGKYGDGNGLWLVVTTPERRSWSLRYMLRGKSREMTLGSVEHLSLAEARDKATDARRLLAQGIDPLDARRDGRAALVAKPAQVTTFAEAANRYIAQNEAGWRNPKHRQQWRNTLTTYAFKEIGDMPVADVDTPAVLKVLTPIWTNLPETASRVRGRVEAVLDFARVQGWRDGSNPAVWRGHLALALPAKAKVRKVEHHAALDWGEMPVFMAELRQRDGIGARALEFAILTAARSGELRRALWSEIDTKTALWTVPAARMKAGRQHRAPLSNAALTLLRGVAEGREDGAPDALVFPGMRPKRPLSDMSLTAVLRRMNRGDLTAHGFRSSFRDWAAETGHPADIAEAALAHTVGDKTVAAYQRGDLLERRRKLMTAWAKFCDGE
jgi:integrase